MRKCKILKRLFTVIISLTLILTEINITSPNVYATSYDPTMSATWAVQNYTKVSDNVLCAEFVSKCLQMGGCDFANYTIVGNLYEALQNRSEFTQYTMAKTGSSKELYATGSNAGKVSVGDILIFYNGNYSSAPYMHAAIVTRIDSKGIVYATQTNPRLTDMNYIWSFHNKTGTVTAIYNFHYNGGSSTSPPTQAPITFQAPTYSNVTETTAYVETKVTADCSQLSRVGMIWNEEVGNSYHSKTEFSWSVGNKLTKISVDFGKEKDKNGNLPILSPGTSYECNFFAVTKAGKILYSTVVRFTTKPAAVSDTTPPVISNVKVTPTDGGYYVECDVYDNVGVTKVAFPTWTIQNGQDDLQWPIGEVWSHKGDGTATYVIKINASDHNYEEGYYTTHIYAYDAAGNQSMVAVSPDTYVDRTAPVISNIEITDQTNTGYTVQCKVTDNVAVSQVQFPTWTEKNGQDDIIWGEGTKNGDIYSYRVNISDHNNEYGTYHTHIYAYDKVRNRMYTAAPDSNISTINITRQPEDYTAGPGESFPLIVKAAGDNLHYQWQCKKNGGDWVDYLPGKSLSTIWLSTGSHNIGQTQYRCIITDGINTLISRVATISVIDMKRYTVTFDSQGGTAVKPSSHIRENTPIGDYLPDPPSKNNFEFMGWYTEPNGEGSQFDKNSIVSKNMTVYAYWRVLADVAPKGFWVTDIPAQNYTGKAIKPQIEVYDGTKLLREKIDYTISYKNNRKANQASNAAAPTVIVRGKGNYSGTETVTFSILPKNIDSDDIEIKDITKPFKNTIQKAVPTVKWNGKKLNNKTDFTLQYPDKEEGAYTAEGIYQIDIIGKGNFTGKRSILFTIGNKKQISKVTVEKIPDQPYTGLDILPEITARDGKVQLEENRDYFLSFENTREIGKATIILNGMGAYCGEKRVSFKITGRDIKNVVVENVPESVEYTGNSITLEPYLIIENDGAKVKLEEEKDYTVSYQKNKAVGTAAITFKGINHYAGTLKKTFKITPYRIGQDTAGKMNVDGNLSTVYMLGGSKPKPTVSFGTETLTEGRDYTLKYSNNNTVSLGGQTVADDAPVITVCGKGNFAGSLRIPFEITPQDISLLTIETPDKVFQSKTGKCLSVPKITDVNGKVLKAGRDYESEIIYTYAEDTVLLDGLLKTAGSPVELTDILPAGTKVLVTVTGKGNYTGMISDIYRMTQLDLKKAKVKIPKQTYTGGELCPGKEQIEVTIGGVTLADTDYEIVRYQNNIKKGTATVIIRGRGDYGGTKKASFKIGAKGFKWWWR